MIFFLSTQILLDNNNNNFESFAISYPFFR